MWAVAPFTPWSTEDDLLLRKALEAGASLESLAKGAVQFSRRFTVTELKNRWNSLLYDLQTSNEASVRMTEFERAAFKLTSKSKKADQSKANEDNFGTGKRKAGSIRRRYYALRKRTCRELLNHGNLSFLGDSYNISGCEAPGANNVLGDQMANQFGLQDPSFNNLNAFPHVMTNEFPPCGVGAFSNGQINRLRNSIEHNSVQNKIPLGNSMSMSGNCTRLGQVDPSKKLQKDHYIFQAVEANLVSNIEGIMGSDFEGDTMMNCPGPDCEVPFSPMHYTSAPPQMPDWKEIEGVSVQGLTEDANIEGNNVMTGESFSISDGGGAGEGASEYNVNYMDAMKNSTDCPEDYFVELADSLFDFTFEEIPDDAIDKSYLDGLSSLLLNSPYDANDEMTKIPETQELAVPVACPNIASTNPEEAIGVGYSHMGLHECSSENQVPLSASTAGPQFPEYCNGVICCTLNTEDPEIPCNDHIVLPSGSGPRLLSARRRMQNEPTTPRVSGKNGNGNQAIGKGMFKVEPKQFEESNPVSQVRGPEKLVDKSCPVSDSGDLQSGAGGVNQKGQPMPTITDQGCHAVEFMATEPGGELLLSDKSEEQYSESDTDIPSFSDVESMILDMDLEADDGDSFYDREVAEYQHEEYKRKIIRLEQTANSCMQRHIAKHRALAILYNQYSTHYIKKPEVLLGRGTDEVAVDIDLGRDGHANVISRRQAIIKMEKDGTFYLVNLGKRSIYVEHKKISKGEYLRLHSSCLIEILGVCFMFDFLKQTKGAKQFVRNDASKSEVKVLGVL